MYIMFVITNSKTQSAKMETTVYINHFMFLLIGSAKILLYDTPGS